jgi:hypothetical protein
MAQLKWLIWIAILVIVIRLAIKERDNASDSSLKEVAESIAKDTLSAEERMIQWKSLATQKAVDHYMKNWNNLASGEAAYTYQDSFSSVTFDVTFGDFFTEGVKNLALSTRQPNGYEKQMFVVTNGQASSMLTVSNTDGSRNDTILDVNGDGKKEWMIFSKDGIRLILPDSTGLSFKEISGLKNVCFSPSEQLVRGKLNNQNVYFKQVWKGDELITVEYLYPHPENVNWLIKSDSLYNDISQAKGNTLWYLPKDYRNVDECILNGGL